MVVRIFSNVYAKGLPNVGIKNHNPIKPIINVKGKPTEKICTVGATLETIPINIFKKSNAVSKGKDIQKPNLKISNPHSQGFTADKKSKGLAVIGNALKLWESAWNIIKWPLITTKVHAIINENKLVATVPCEAVIGSKKPAKFNPIFIPINSPAYSIQEKTNLTAKPIVKPMIICCTTNINAVEEPKLTLGMGGMLGWIANAIKNANPTFTEFGVFLLLKTGNIESKANALIKGHINGFNQDIIWYSLNVIMFLFQIRNSI